MNAQDAPADPPRALSDRAILSIVAAYAAAFVLFGLMLQSPPALLGGLGAIVTTRDALLADYFGVGGGCVNAGLLTLAAASFYWRTSARITGASVAARWLRQDDIRLRPNSAASACGRKVRTHHFRISCLAAAAAASA